MDIITALLIVGAVMVVLCVGFIVAYKVMKAKDKFESSRSLPQGSDGSDFSKILQEKYKAERDSGEFKRQEFL